MKKPLLVLLIVALALAAAPVALADHCVTCRFGNCGFATTGGYQSCTDLGSTCSLSGSCGGPHPFTETEEPLAIDFVVASVERLDEPQQPVTAETRVASAETGTTRQNDVRR